MGSAPLGAARTVSVKSWRLSRIRAVSGTVSACSRSVDDDRSMTSEADPAARPGHDWVVIASFENRHAAEHVLASLGHELRRNARKGRSDAFVVSGNADGSLKLTESRCGEPAVLLPSSPTSPPPCRPARCRTSLAGLDWDSEHDWVCATLDSRVARRRDRPFETKTSRRANVLGRFSPC